MSTYVLMKILESAPSRYDKGIRFLTCGRLDSIYDRLTAHIHQGQQVLDIGCGTGALSLRAARKGANIKAIDINPQMLEIARQQPDDAQLSSKIGFCEMGVAELGNEASDSYDTVMSGLCLSELTTDELNYTIPRPDICVQCGACIVQCPCDALFFQSPKGEIIFPESIRKFKLNLMGKRLVKV